MFLLTSLKFDFSEKYMTALKYFLFPIKLPRLDGGNYTKDQGVGGRCEAVVNRNTTLLTYYLPHVSLRL